MRKALAIGEANGQMPAMIRTIDTDAHLAEGLDHLSRLDPRFGAIVERLGPPALRRAPEGLDGLLRIITEQMLSLKAADAIWRRIEAEIAPFDPAAIVRKREATWLKLGLSRAKARSFKALAKAVASGQVPLDRFGQMSDAEIAAALTSVPGIGPWTVEIYLLSHLGRSDVWPAGDLALQIAVHDAFGLNARPTEKAMRTLSESWQPWRAVAARLLWAHYRSLKNIPQLLD